MHAKPLGDLRLRSKSLGDFAMSARAMRNWAFEKATDKTLDSLLPDGTPDDLANMLKDQGRFFLIWLEAALFSSSLGRTLRISPAAQRLHNLAKAVPSMQTALKVLAANDLYEPVRRMLLVADANQIDLERSQMRIVDSNLTPYQAVSQSRWAGSLAEFRTGSIITGPADPRGYFAIYFPNERRNLRGSFIVTKITCNYQDRLT
jgi:hypothetical protein